MLNYRPPELWTGSYGELLVAADMLKRGCKVYFPYMGNMTRTDVLGVKAGISYNMQVKTITSSEGGIVKVGGTLPTKNVEDDWNVYAIVSIDRGGMIAYVPRWLVEKRGHIRLRFDEPSYKLKRKLLWFNDFGELPDLSVTS